MGLSAELMRSAIPFIYHLCIQTQTFCSRALNPHRHEKPRRYVQLFAVAISRLALIPGNNFLRADDRLFQLVSTVVGCPWT